jgi:hypothetical protein
MKDADACCSGVFCLLSHSTIECNIRTLITAENHRAKAGKPRLLNEYSNELNPRR